MSRLPGSIAHLRRWTSLMVAALGAILALSTLALSSQAAVPSQSTPPPTPTVGLMSIANETCLECHGRPGLSMPLENGETLDLYAPADEYEASVHGSLGYACVQCHTQVGNYPHPEYRASSLRQVTFDMNAACQRCHDTQYQLAQDSVHARAITNGMPEAAVCTDCHSAHATQRVMDPETHLLLPEARLWVPQTCAKCHSEIYEKYLTSVHGKALVDEDNRDVPTCVDCHGVHNIEDPTTTAFRLKSPTICANCHTNPQIMDKYDISTNVLNTYVSDFHGTTVLLFEKQTPDAETNKPVCYDCHGIHDIPSVDDPVNGLKVKENLLARCQVCHPGASANFPTAWLSHYIPSPEKYPLVYYVNLFYQVFIPTILGGMALLVVLDFTKAARTNRMPQRATIWMRARARQVIKLTSRYWPKPAKRAEEEAEVATTIPPAEPEPTEPLPPDNSEGEANGPPAGMPGSNETTPQRESGSGDEESPHD